MVFEGWNCDWDCMMVVVLCLCDVEFGVKLVKWYNVKFVWGLFYNFVKLGENKGGGQVYCEVLCYIEIGGSGVLILDGLCGLCMCLSYGVV